MQIKTTTRYHLIPVRIGIIKNSTNNKCWRGCREKGTLVYCWQECKLVQPRGKQYEGFSESYKNYHMTQQFHFCIYIQKNPKNTNLKRYMHPNVHSSIIYNSHDMEAT